MFHIFAKESIEVRREMVEMHDTVLKRIDTAYKNEQYIEVCWLCYACFENRVNRILEKICAGCTKEQRKNSTRIGITTKLECYSQLIKSGYPPLKNGNTDFINTIKGWCKERNALIHGMVSLEYYNEADKKFKNLAKRGIPLVKKMYSFGTDVRDFYYQAEEIPPYEQSVMKKCRLKYKCIQEENRNVNL